MFAADQHVASRDGATQALCTGTALARLRKICLVVSRGPEAGRRVALDKDLFVLGKDPSCDLFIADPTVSRRHLEIEKRGDTFVVRDLGSNRACLHRVPDDQVLPKRGGSS